ncbi:MAG: DinB family protein [Terriglobales bacterium]
MKHLAWLLMIALASTTAARAQQTAAPAASYNSEVMAVIEEQEKKVVSLAEAVPQEKYTWAPGEGVRNTAQIYLHIALANYAFAGFLGVKPPEGFVMKGFDTSTTDKAKIVEHLKRSFDNLKQAVRASTDLEKKVKVFGEETTARDAMLRAASHNGEHMGQSIAYARMSGVVPPWTAAEQAQQKPAPPAKK